MGVPQLPNELERLIVGHAVTGNLARVAHELRTDLQPHLHGSVHNAFFLPNPALAERAIAPTREVRKPLPAVLTPLYESYPPNTEFAARSCGLVFRSEDEMEELVPGRIVDMAYAYAGMGSVSVHSYDKGTDQVLTCRDGGANGFERQSNRAQRVRAVHAHARGEDSPHLRVRGFEQWWEDTKRAASDPRGSE